MIRFCVRNSYAQGKSLLQHTTQIEATNNIKCTSMCHNIFRQYAIKLKDDNKLERIYYGPLTPQIKAVKVFSLSSSVAGLIAQPIIIKQAASIGSTSLIIGICSVVGFFTFVTPILLHFITKKYVTEIHYEPITSTYKATTITFWLSRKQLEFTADDVVVPDVPGMFVTMIAKGKPLFVEARHFTDPLHYAKIMGYDKPLDFKLGDTGNQS